MKPSAEQSAEKAAASDVMGSSEAAAKESPSPGNGGKRIGELRRLLVGSDEVSEVLPDAFSKSSKKNNDLSEATLPVVENNIRQSVIRDPKILADALFPVIGPAIRKAITSALNTMVQSFNQILEHSVSPKGLRWRLEAMRTGRSFGEVVLLKTLLYRVEQVFFIHRETGLLLDHVSQNPQDVEDKDMVSAMLTAITDFARDSFDTGDDSTLDSFNVSGLTVWVESGPSALLATVIRGNPPLELRETFSETIEKLHQSFEREFTSYSGNADIFAAAHPLLEECLVSQIEEKEEEKSRSLSPAHVILGAMGLALIVLIGYFAWDYWRWSGLIEDIRNEPGFVMTDYRRGWTQHSVAGLRDPLAGDPAKLLENNYYDADDVSLTWREFQDTDPKFVLARANSILLPASGVQLEVRDGILTVRGDASADWLLNAKRTGPLLAGVDEVKIATSEEALISTVENLKLPFACGSADIRSGEAVDSALEDIRKLAVLGSYKVDIIGYADQSGSTEINKGISLKRANAVGEAFGRKMVRDPLAANIIFNATRAEELSNECKVTFKVTPLNK